MRQLKVREMIEKIEKTEESLKEEKEESEKIEKKAARKPQMKTAAATWCSTPTSSGSKTPGRTPKEGRMNEKLGLGTGYMKDGGQFKLRTSLRNIADLVKNEKRNGENGARKRNGVKDLIGRFGGDRDGKGPSDNSGMKRKVGERSEDN